MRCPWRETNLSDTTTLFPPSSKRHCTSRRRQFAHGFSPEHLILLRRHATHLWYNEPSIPRTSPHSYPRLLRLGAGKIINLRVGSPSQSVRLALHVVAKKKEKRAESTTETPVGRESGSTQPTIKLKLWLYVKRAPRPLSDHTRPDLPSSGPPVLCTCVTAREKGRWAVKNAGGATLFNSPPWWAT